MDHQFYQPPIQNKHRCQWMEQAAFFCGLLAVSSICVVYPAFIAGALGIVFALLSRGGEMTFTPKAKAGLIMGSIGLGIITFMLLYTIITAYVCFGGIEEMMEFMYEQLESDYSSLFQTR